ncbi:aldehyde dehydrogenase family protein [Rhodococcus fascians]|nr:aldehyde dehydrogenase family protein [Rhodococcus fascians]MBY4061015.1 aldehyde dehydrogenase family protein [Rhodococcus fascians]MBY4071180.1 aldehyde dehydrogenase family protein [Rhodococcus fascians]
MLQATQLTSIFAGGTWIPASGDRLLEIFDPSNGSIRGEVRSASAADVDTACAAAAQAFDAWSRTDPRERAQIVARIAEGLTARSDELADAITAEVGTPRNKCAAMQIGPATTAFASAARLAETVLQDERIDDTVVQKVPVGVVACITPWNYPLFQIATKLAPALVAGCTVVLKPSEVAPTCVAILADICVQAGLPAGVFNVVFGDGPTTGEALISHPAVDFVSFTGSTRAGARIATVAGACIKQVSLELGGKSASLVLPDADFALAVPQTLAKSFQNSGQTCAALTRLLVPNSRLDETAALLGQHVPSYAVGDPADDRSVLGPVATAEQRAKVRELTTGARAAGAQLLACGPVAGDEYGYYVPAEAYLTGPDDLLSQEEVFGPVLAVIGYSDVDDAVAIANNSPYGLSGAVWGADPHHAGSVAARIRTGSIGINGAKTHPDAPFGGFRQSGFGRERGAHGIDEFLTTRAIHY